MSCTRQDNMLYESKVNIGVTCPHWYTFTFLKREQDELFNVDCTLLSFIHSYNFFFFLPL